MEPGTDPISLGTCIPVSFRAEKMKTPDSLRSDTTKHQILVLMALLCLVVTNTVKGQYWIELNSPSQASPCVEYPIEVTFYNDDGDPTGITDFQLNIPDGFSYNVGSAENGVSEKNINDPQAPVFEIPDIPQCESFSFILWLSHECLQSTEEKEISGAWQADGNGSSLVRANTSIRIFGLALRIFNVNIYFDSTDLSFKKTFSLLNTGQVPLNDFIFYIEGDDNMDILNTNRGQLSNNGDTITFKPADFEQIGNGNRLFEPGEEILIEHDIDLFACDESFPFLHKMVVPCGKNTCVFEVESSTELKVTIGQPRFILRQVPDQNATPCDTGIAMIKLFNWSNAGSFPQSNAMYDIQLNPGWSIVQNNRRTPPRRDNCLRVVEARIKGTDIPIRTQGFSGYGLDLTRLTQDPDGPGGLTDIDGDGRYDDLFAGDTICIELRYLLDRSCINVRCSGEVFDSRLLRMEADFRNYCNEDGENDFYINRHYYYWSGYGGAVGGLDGVYADGDHDTLTVTLSKAVAGFLQNCDNDSAVVRIDFPRVVSLPPGAIVIANGDTVNYNYSGRRLTIYSDTNRFRIQVPIIVSCDPGSGGNIQTACTFCVGSGFPKHRIRFEMDYFCGDNCYGGLPLICGRSGEFISVCDSAAAGIISEGKFVIEDMIMKRTSLGYEDENYQDPVQEPNDSLDLATLMAFDTFLLHIPLDIRCDANYSRVVFKLVQQSIIRFMANQRDTMKYFEFISDTLKFYDGETDRWSTCINPLSNEFFNTRNDGYRNNYVKEVNLSNLGCLRGQFSSADSLVFIVKGRVKNTLRNNVRRVQIRSDLSYLQDGCDQNARDNIIFNAFSGVPHSGFVNISQPYTRDTNYTRFYPYVSICGDFELNVTVDNIYFNVDTIDPFVNEYRKAYELTDLKILIPEFFEIDSLPFNHIREYYNSTIREFKRDTNKIAFRVYDSADVHVVNFPILADKDYFAVRHYFRNNLIPNCYGFIQDSIHIIKRMRIQLQSSSPVPRDTVIHQYYPLNVIAPEPVFDNLRQQYLYDSISITNFELISGVETYEPEDHFNFHHTWLLLKHHGSVIIDSLVEYTDSTSKIWTPEIIGPDFYAYRLDTTYLSRKFRLHSEIETCQPDTLIFTFGNSCDGYPADWNDIESYCATLQEKREVIIQPEVPDLQIKFISTPDSLHNSPCDTFEYEIEVRNSDLGHAINHQLILDLIPGMTYLDGEIEFPDSNWMALNVPVLQGNNLIFDLSSLFDSTGMQGFYNPGLNVYNVRLRYLGDCDIQDGALLSVEAIGLDLCQEYVTSGKINSPPLFFKKDSLAAADDLYDLRLEFTGDTLCGETFRMRAIWTSVSPLTLVEGQRIGLSYKKELSFLDRSYIPVKNIDSRLFGFQTFQDWEQLYIDVIKAIPLGDSIVFEALFERTCIGVCKPTELAFEILTPQDIGCPGAPGGSCRLKLNTQNWRFDSLIVAPNYTISAGNGRLIRQADGTEILVGDITVNNLSPFAISAPLVIRFYEDANSNGLYDAGDLLRQTDTLDGSQIGPYGRIDFQTSVDWPFDGNCNWLALISPLDNECICRSDTLIFPPLEIIPQSASFEDCYSNLIEIGFDSLAGYDYTWSDPTKISSDKGARVMYQYDGDINKNGTAYDTLFVTATRFGGCAIIDTVYVQLYRPQAMIKMTDSIRCYGDQTAALEASMTGGQGNSSFVWSNGETTDQVEDLGIGTYQVIVTDENNCRDTVEMLIDQPPPLSDSLWITSDYNGYPIRCHGDSSGSVTIAAGGGTPGYRIEWNGTVSTDFTIDGLTEGWTQVGVIDRYGCRIQDSIYLDQPPPLMIESEGTKAGCDEEHLASGIAVASGGVNGYTYDWSSGARGDSIGGLDAGTYEVSATDINGCMVIDTLEIERHDDPGISVNILDTLVQYGQRILLHANSTALNGNFIWYPGDKVTCDTCQSTYVTPTESLVIEVRVIDENGCEDWAEIIIDVEITKRVWAPNVITVNDDGLNDGFTLFGNSTLQGIEYLKIFDRWGELVFHKENFEPGLPLLGWQGDLNGEFMDPAVFAWVAKVHFVDGETAILFGDVTLVR